MTIAVSKAQTTILAKKVTLDGTNPATLIAPNKSLAGARILNWTASPIYLAPGTLAVVGTPAAGAPSDFIPAAAAGVPGQYVAEFAPMSGLVAMGASAGDLTVITW